MIPAPSQHQVQPMGNSYYPENPNDLTGGLPINLDSLRDGPPGTKPFYPYSTLIRYAIKGSPNQKLLLEDIYYAIESRFPYFRTAPAGWKNSVRHNLSLNPCFEKVPRPLTDRGKGSYWTVNDNVDPRTGVHRVRKRKQKSSEKQGEHAQDHEELSPEEQQQPQEPQAQLEGDYAGPSAETAAAAADVNVYQDPNFVAQNVMNPEAAGPNRQPQPQPYPPPYGTYDPTYGMRYAIPPFFRPDEALHVDEHGNADWAQAWRKELAGLFQATEQQDKAGADQEWYRQMLFRVRYAMTMMMPVVPGAPPELPGAPTGGVQVSSR